MNLEDLSFHAWVQRGGFVNELGAPITFREHKFLYRPAADWSPRQVYKKAAQVGMSVLMNLKAIFAAKSPRFRFNVIYTLPSDSDVYEFVPTKTDKIIQANEALRRLVTTDKVEMKEVADRFVHFKGTRSKTAPIMTSADLLIRDEMDRSDQHILAQYPSRLGRSAYRGIWDLSNPSVVNAGVDRIFKLSDRKEWYVACGKCGHEQRMGLGLIDEARAAYACGACGAELTDADRMLGRWVAENPGAEISGYHISQLMAPWISARRILRDRDEKDPEYFANFVLGEPVAAGDAEDFRRVILDAWTPRTLDVAPFFMGIDVGRVKHWVLGNREGIFKVGRCESREDVESLIRRWNPYVVMDAGPELTWAQEFRKKYPRLAICFYKRDKDRKEIVRWLAKRDRGIVHVDRNRAIDRVVDDMLQAEILFALDPDDLERYIAHWDVMVRKQEPDAQGNERFVWEKNSETAADHWVHATVYYWVARSRGKPAEFAGSPPARKEGFIEEAPGGGFRMRDLGEFLPKEEGP